VFGGSLIVLLPAGGLCITDGTKVLGGIGPHNTHMWGKWAVIRSTPSTSRVDTHGKLPQICRPFPCPPWSRELFTYRWHPSQGLKFDQRYIRIHIDDIDHEDRSHIE